jgi:hypothetical protein
MRRKKEEEGGRRRKKEGIHIESYNSRIKNSRFLWPYFTRLKFEGKGHVPSLKKSTSLRMPSAFSTWLKKIISIKKYYKCHRPCGACQLHQCGDYSLPIPFQNARLLQHL